MNETFIPPELQEVIVGTQGKVPSNTGILSIGDGRYAMTLPDGTKVIVDQYGNIIGWANPRLSKNPKRGDGIPSPRFLPSIPLGSPSGRAVTEGD